MNEQQRNFENFAEEIIRIASRILHEGEDLNSLELQLEKIETLHSMYVHLGLQYNVDHRLIQLSNLKEMIESRINLLQNEASQPLLYREENGGRPKLLINENIIRILRQEGHTWIRIADIFGVSYRTILRRRIELNLPDDLAYTNISNDDLDNEIRNIQREQPFSGQIIIAGVLRSRGIRVHRQRLRESLNRVDAWGMVQRWSNIIPRRVYQVAGPNALWHIDGNHKLIRWKFVVHAGIDGYSRMITFCNCSSNNKSITVLTQFQKGIEQFGIPSRVRADHGGENALVKQFMERYRGYGRGSFIAGRSVHNQRIERLWGDINRCVLKIYKTIFLYLEENFELDIDNNVYLFCLHLTYLNRINKSLKLFVDGWNNHSIRTEHFQTPLQLFTSGMIECGYRGMEDFNVNELYGIDWEGPIPSNSDDNAAAVVVEDPRNVLNQNEYHELLNSVGIDREDNNYGINVYLDT
ncbi:4956_t:CDS:2 [Entrophospora sp. SA101]|nr:20127_t:CDS:2 [Entrophospora sp. SA101]CAJ0826218.1 20152_t:CDS:2 [Entrophospora sp. SA101]CAJ0864063.1 4956_t:CDS:2 [Entrophospora sp. SA101]